MSRSPTPIRLNPDEARLLESWLEQARLQAKRAERARIVLFAAEGHPTEWIAAQLGTRPARVSKWRTRYAKYGVEGLKDLKRSGKPARRDPADDERVLDLLLSPAPSGRGEWTAPALASASGLDINYVRRVLKSLGGHIQRVPPQTPHGSPAWPEVRVAGLFLSLEFLSFAVYAGPQRLAGTLSSAESLAAWIEHLTEGRCDNNAIQVSQRSFREHISRLSETAAAGVVHVVYAAATALADLPALKNVTYFRTSDSAAWLEQIPVWFAVLSEAHSGAERPLPDCITASINHILQRQDVVGGACLEWLYTIKRGGSRQTCAEVSPGAVSAG